MKILIWVDVHELVGTTPKITQYWLKDTGKPNLIQIEVTLNEFIQLYDSQNPKKSNQYELPKFPKAEVTVVSDKFMITENGKNIIDDTYGEDVRTSDSIEQAWIRAYTTNFVWDRNLNRRVKGVSKPSEFDNQEF